MQYRVREVDASDDEIADELRALHTLSFFDDAPFPTFEEGWWWIAKQADEVAGFAGLNPGFNNPGYGYCVRAGVVHSHRGRGLHRRLLRAREAKARRLGFKGLVTDTTANAKSANNLIKAGFLIYHPERPWAFVNSIYWRKEF